MENAKQCRITMIALYEINSVYQIGLLGYKVHCNITKEGTSRQRSGKGAIRKRFPLQKPRWEKKQTNSQVLIP